MRKQPVASSGMEFVFLLVIIFWLAVVSGLIWIIVHFISKFW